MMNRVSPDDLFQAAGLISSGRAAWGEVISETGPGVYVVSIADLSDVRFEERFEVESAHWHPGEEIIYIGRSRHLSQRLRQFYRHKYGDRSPHRGGQAILLLECAKLVDWASAPDDADAERRLLEAFEQKAGFRPFGNRMRSASRKAIRV